MTQDDVTYHDSEFMVAMASHLKLDPKQITTMEATGDGSGEVTITWSGYTTMPIDTFNEILDTVNQSKVAKGQL